MGLEERMALRRPTESLWVIMGYRNKVIESGLQIRVHIG